MHLTSAPLRPMNIGDILDTTFRIYRNNFLLFIGIAALLQVPLILLQISMNFAFGGVMADYMQLIESLPAIGSNPDILEALPINNLIGFGIVTGLFVLVQALVAQQLMVGALTNATARRYQQNEPTSVLEAYNFGLGRMAALIGAALIIGLIMLVVFALLFGCFFGTVIVTTARSMEPESSSGAVMLVGLMILGGFGLLALTVVLTALITVRLAFFPQAIVLEGCGPIAGLGRSWQLVRGSFWRVLGLAVLLYLLMQVLIFVPGAAIGAVIQVIFNDPIRDFAIRQSLTNLMSYSLQILLFPLSMIAYTLMYYDLRVRKEGYDLQLRAMDSAAPEQHTPHISG